MAKKADIQMGFRIPSELHKECLISAESMGITLASWIRGAMIMRLKQERENRAPEGDEVFMTRDQIRAVLKEELLKMKEELTSEKK